MLTLWQGFVLGLLQGIAEWLPISSEAVVNLVALNVFKIPTNTSLQIALLLHLGTVMAAMIYFRRDLKQMMSQGLSQSNNKLFFIVSSTAISIVIGGLLYLGLQALELSSAVLTIGMGIALLATAYLLSRQSTGSREFREVNKLDAGILGLTQGLAVMPGISRSGSTMAVGLWRKFSLDQSIVISFIMGIPMIMIGATLLIFTEDTAWQAVISWPGLLALLTSMAVGYLTIGWLIGVAKKVSFEKFVTVFGVLAILVGFLSL